ncbi:Mss4-like protein [Crassisporium funariophilum]|nr:Mss4-like protein [Crassisporium funariophilum]
MKMSLTYVKAECHCGSNQFKIPFLTSTLPLASDLCHCTSCRHITGELAVHCEIMRGTPLAVDSEEVEEKHKQASLSGLTKYNASKDLTRYFCTTCSAYMLYETASAQGTHWSVSTGVLERIEGIVKVGHHAFVGDTLDGGLADHYRALDGVELPRYELEEKDGKTLPLGWKSDALTQTTSSLDPATDKLAAYCHCKTISVYLARPTDPKDPSKWWVAPGKTAADPARFMCGHCLCRSCRLTSGSLIQSWVILAAANVVDASSGAPVVFAKVGSPEGEGRIAGMKQYCSSAGVYREFCGTCGASAFYWNEGGEKVDVGAGLLDEKDGGARAERFCFWYNRVIYPEDAIDKAGAEALKEGVKNSGA